MSRRPRSRSMERRTPPPPPSSGGARLAGGELSPQYSSYYKERFGSQSPEEYRSLRITNIDPKIHGEDLRDVLDKYFRKYGELHTKIVRQMDAYERIAYVNFEHPDDARDAKHDCIPKIYSVLGKRVKIDPANVIRDQGGKFIQKMAGPPPPGPHPGYGGGGGRTRSRSPLPPPPPPYMDYGGGRGGGGGGSRGPSYQRMDSYDRYPPKDFDPRDNRRRQQMGGGGDFRSHSPPRLVKMLKCYVTESKVVAACAIF